MPALPKLDPKLGDRRAAELIETIIVPRMRDLGGFSVRRALALGRVPNDRAVHFA